MSLPMVRAEANRLYHRGDYAGALPFNQEYVDRFPGNARGRYECGRTLLALGRASEAREQMTLAYNIEPSSEEYLLGLADAMVANDEPDALVALLRHQAEDRATPTDYIRLGTYARKIGHADEAERALLEAAELDGGKSPAPQRALAEFYRSVSDRENEVKRLRMLLWFDQNDAKALNRLRELGEVPGPSFVLEPVGRDD